MKDFEVCTVFKHSTEVAKSKFNNVMNFYSSNKAFSIEEVVELLNNQTVANCVLESIMTHLELHEREFVNPGSKTYHGLKMWANEYIYM